MIRISDANLRSEASADPYAGTTAGNGKPIWTPDQAAVNLNRTGANWYQGNGGALNDGVLTFGFWKDYQDLANSYYVSKDGQLALDEAFNEKAFSAFTPAQQAMAARVLAQWDDLINIKIVRADNAASADLVYGNTEAGPASGAYTYLPLGDKVYGDLAQYGFENAYKLGGDVWVNGTYAPNFESTTPGSYAYFTLLHESGHALGLSHPGDYNASDDDDGDGKPDPITYQNDAYYFQDSQQYTIMSYFGEDVTGASWVDWQKLQFTYAMTPMVHDIEAVQRIYGADMSTRVGNTTYGFNSNAGSDVFDFNKTPSPVFTVWDAGGTDTFDFSGFATDEVINLNQGAFSSASKGATLEYLKSTGFLPANATQAQLDRLFASYGSGPQGQMHDNIAIAYGAVIENATAGSGNDLLIGNEVANVLRGNAGVDTASYRDADAGVAASLLTMSGSAGDARGDKYFDIEKLEGSNFADTLTGGNGNDGLIGLGGNDVLNGGIGADTLDGGAGNDTLDGGNGNDVLTGGVGNDLLWGGNDVDRLDGGDGSDTLDGGNGNDALAGGIGNDTLSGGNDNDRLEGGDGNDTLDGGNGNDILIGGLGADVLKGGNGNDELHGGAGADMLTGGSGRDVFFFADLGSTSIITDFKSGEDRIDFTGLDAIKGTAAVDPFTWIGSNAFDGTAGELRAYVSGGSMFIAGDVNGDKVPDFMINIGAGHITTTDLILV